VGAVVNAIATVDADVRFVSLLIPEDSFNWAGVSTATAADAFARIEYDSTTFPGHQCINGTYL
jgi:hypothetical protein